jgi:glycosyltransferase involved in cell wall biosynthesis
MVTPYFPPIINGPSLHVYHLVRGLVNHGVNVHVHTMGFDVDRDILDLDATGFTISHFKPFSLLRGASFDQPLSITYIQSAIDNSDDYDVVHVHDFPKLCNDSLILALKKIKPSKRVVLTPHGAGPLSPAYKVSSKAYWATGIPVAVVKSVDRLITVTSLQTKGFVKVCNGQKVVHIPEAIPDYYFVKEPYFVNDERLKILYIGRIIQEKGIKDLLFAIHSALKSSNRLVELRCIGPDYGFMQEALKMIKDLHLQDHVHMLGPLSEEQKIKNLRWCDVLVLPSYYEAFGIPIIEAMASGKPVIATKTIGAMSLVRNHETGFLVDFSDPAGIANRFELLKDITLRMRMGAAALKDARSFTMSNMSKNHIRLYQSLSYSK